MTKDQIIAKIKEFIASGKRTGRLYGQIFMSRRRDGCSFYIESSRHPNFPNTKKQISYTTWEEAWHAHENLLPPVNRMSICEDDSIVSEVDTPITKEQFQESLRNWTVCVAEAHAIACEESSPDADYWCEMHSRLASLMNHSHRYESSLIGLAR